MELGEGVRLIRRAREQVRDERLFTQWVVQLPMMTAEQFISFADYKARAIGTDIDLRPTETILAELDEVERELKEVAHGT